MGNNTLRIGSMFSGSGGLDLAAESVLHATPAWFCEWDEAPAKVLAQHWPEVPNHRDVTQIDWDTMPPVDVITGGYPCQPFSQAGLRKGERDERHLWPHVRAAIRHLRPRFAFLENVAGHRSLGLDRVLGDLAEDGANVWWTSLRASDAGAPHHRERIFILVVPADSDGVGLEAQRLARRPETPKSWDHDGEHALAWAHGVSDLDHLVQEAGLKWGAAGMNIGLWAEVMGPPPLVTVDQVTYRDEDLWGQAFPESKPGINPEFVEWMMGLPAGHVTGTPGLTRAQQLKILGNGVVPQQAAMALRWLLDQAAHDMKGITYAV